MDQNIFTEKVMAVSVLDFDKIQNTIFFKKKNYQSYSFNIKSVVVIWQAIIMEIN